MTKQESFKKRVRARMATTGERYSAARKSLIDQVDGNRRRTWVSEPEFSDAALIEATGKGWDDWCDVIEAWPGHSEGHKAIATYVREELDVDGWWAQGITGGYERITGLRLPYQMADGTFTANKSMTVHAEGDTLRALLVDDDDRRDLFGGLDTELRSKATSKSLRIRVGPGSALITIEPKDDGRCKVVVAHEQLPYADDVAEWKYFWTEWLEALDD